MRMTRIGGPLLLAVALAPLAAMAGGKPLMKVKMSVDEDPLVPHLAASLGYLRDEGVEIVPVKITDHAANDYQFQTLLAQGKIDIAYHWFNHAVFGARNGHPITAVMMINDAPAMEVLVAERRKGDIRGAGDFKGANVAEGASYGTKSVITGYLAQKAGLPPHSYTSVIKEVAGRQQAVMDGLKAGKVDVVTAQEPMVSALKKQSLASTLYDLSSGAATARTLGSAWPAQSLLVAPAYLQNNPHAVQRVVNAYVRTLRFMASHDVEAIVEELPASYFAGKDRAAEIEHIRATLSSYAVQDYRIGMGGAALVDEVIRSSRFDDSPAGKWRAAGHDKPIALHTLFDNRFVDRAMKRYPATTRGSASATEERP